MKKFFLILLLIFWAYVLFDAGYLPGGGYLAHHTSRIFKPLTMFSSKEAAKAPFSDNETFNFAYTAGPLRVGRAKLTFMGPAVFENKQAYLINFESKVGAFYDLETIYADALNFYPLYIERNISNFGVKSKITEKYNQQSNLLEITKQGIIKTISSIIKKEQPIHNALLLIYYCRALPLEELKTGHEFNAALPSDEFKVIFTGTEQIKVPAGSFKAYVFESAPKKMKLWISVDHAHTPLKMENLTAFGPSAIALDRP